MNPKCKNGLKRETPSTDGSARVSRSVTDAALLEFCLLFGNAFEYERLNPVAGPGIVRLQSFIDLHPVKDIAALSVLCGVV